MAERIEVKENGAAAAVPAIGDMAAQHRRVVARREPSRFVRSTGESSISLRLDGRPESNPAV